MTRFLNRLLGLPVNLQNLVFSYFTDTLGEIVKAAKKAGRWDGGILDFGASGEHVELVESKEFVGDAAFGTATTELHKVSNLLTVLSVVHKNICVYNICQCCITVISVCINFSLIKSPSSNSLTY